ncbi:MAG: SIMPL domain-containing protein [Aigarchaeota archaeon]|nr:SIMPL domain-containing protein [Candidatus Pelearchaeum maunauluense]
MSERIPLYVSVVALAAIAALGVVAYASLTGKPLVEDGLNTTINSDENLLSVMGLATTEVRPDETVITFGVEIREKTPEEALRKAGELSTNVIETIKSLGVSDEFIKTTGYSIYPQYEYYRDGSPPTIVGYIAQHTIEVRIRDPALIGKVLDSAVDSGANRVYGIVFQLSQEARKDLMKRLIREAVEDAYSRAEAAIAAAGVSVKGIKSIEINDVSAPTPIVIGAEKAVETPIMQGLTSYTVSVRVVFIIG